jgi:hypothetical protein
MSLGWFENFNISFKPRRLLAALIFTLLLCIVSGYFSISNIVNYARDLEGYIRRDIDTMLVLAQAEPQADVPYEYEPIGEMCWDYLQDAAIANDGEYTVTIRSVADGALDDPQYDDEAHVQIVFPDGRQAQLLWYYRNFRACEYGAARE